MPSPEEGKGKTRRIHAGELIYVILVTLLLLGALVPKDKTLRDVMQDPVSMIEVDQTVIALALALFLPAVLPRLKKLKLFGVEAELRDEVQRVKDRADELGRELKQTEQTVAFTQYRQEAALFTIATALSRKMFTPDAQDRRAGKSLKESPLQIGQLDFIESWILTRLLYRVLDAYQRGHGEDFGVDCPLHDEPTLMAFFRILTGKRDLFIWYSGTGIKLAGRSFPDSVDVHDAESVREHLNAVYEPLGLTWLPSLGFENAELLVMTKEKAESLQISTVSDLRDQARDLVFGANREYFLRDWLYPQLKRNGVKFKDTTEVGINDRLGGLINDDYQVGVTWGTDGFADYRKLQVITPDEVFPKLPQYAMPVCRTDVAEQVEAALQGWRITEDQIRDLNQRVEREGVRDPQEPALPGIVDEYYNRHSK
ncbi:MAG: hypothetical protein O7C98_14910 [Planctomycetota bacterium]|nr:hypothetical protein [Planctomycetota bacterium]